MLTAFLVFAGALAVQVQVTAEITDDLLVKEKVTLRYDCTHVPYSSPPDSKWVAHHHQLGQAFFQFHTAETFACLSHCHYHLFCTLLNQKYLTTISLCCPLCLLPSPFAFPESSRVSYLSPYSNTLGCSVQALRRCSSTIITFVFLSHTICSLC